MPSRGEPFIAYTLSWNSPSSGVDWQYSLFRSTVPSINSHPDQAVLLCTTDGRCWVDSTGLDWDREYFYAVMAAGGEDSPLWSNEVSVGTPTDPGASPVFLQCQQLEFTICGLSWTRAGSLFSSYSLLRCPGTVFDPDLAYILLSTTDIDETTFVDSLRGAQAQLPCCYSVAMTDVHGDTCYSNHVVFSPGGTVPWRVALAFDPPGSSLRLFDISSDGEVMTGRKYYSYHWHSRLYDTETGQAVGGGLLFPCYIMDFSTGEFVVSYLTDSGNFIAVYSSNLLEELRVHPYPEVASMIECEGEILTGFNSFSALLDHETLEVIRYVPYGFSHAVVSPDGSFVYLLGNSAVVCLSLPGWQMTAAVPGYYSTMACGPDGHLHCANSQRYARLSPGTLAVDYQFEFPEPACIPEVVILPPDFTTVYVPVGSSSGIDFRVYDSQTGEKLGTVVSPFSTVSHIADLLVSPDGEYIWGVATYSDDEQLFFGHRRSPGPGIRAPGLNTRFRHLSLQRSGRDRMCRQFQGVHL